MEFNDWILSFHVLAAFALVGAQVIFWIMIVALWGTDSTSRVTSLMRVSQVATVVIAVGSLGTIVFGVWLAISLDAYQVWDGWVLARARPVGDRRRARPARRRGLRRRRHGGRQARGRRHRDEPELVARRSARRARSGCHACTSSSWSCSSSST